MCRIPCDLGNLDQWFLNFHEWCSSSTSGTSLDVVASLTHVQFPSGIIFGFRLISFLHFLLPFSSICFMLMLDLEKNTNRVKVYIKNTAKGFPPALSDELAVSVHLCVLLAGVVYYLHNMLSFGCSSLMRCR